MATLHPPGSETGASTSSREEGSFSLYGWDHFAGQLASVAGGRAEGKGSDREVTHLCGAGAIV